MIEKLWSGCNRSYLWQRTYNKIEKIIKMLKKEFKGNVAITKHDDIHIVMDH